MSIEQRARWVLLGAILLSLLVHGGASVALALLPSASDMLAAVQRGAIEFEMEEEPPPPVAEPAAEPEAATPDEEVPPTPAEQTPPPPRDPNAPPPSDTPEPPAPLAEQVHDFGGLALTGTGSSWAISAVGSGQDTRGPQGNQLARTTGRDVAGSPDGAVGGTGTAPAAAAPVNYTRRASPPGGMGALLERYYPTGARARGVEGRARVAYRVLPDGTLDVQRVVSESPAGEGFGQACMELLRRSPRWTSALDEAGEPVGSTPPPYSCTFQQR